ncbi:MAG: hypothetical protein J2P57_18365 [Acidimicrobiaceae bacterium]|nr:hypothetical protein [Acidimicrobiaceae bacterium]
MRAVVSVCDRTALDPGAVGDSPLGRDRVHAAAAELAELAGNHQLVITYGTAPQLELLLEESAERKREQGLDVLGAESGAAVGFLLAQELGNQLARDRIALLLTQVRVDPSDPEFRSPGLAVGTRVDESEARRLAALRGWLMRPEDGGYRRVVPSPTPLAVVEADTIALLLASDVVVVCGGGGGIPVVADYAGQLHSVAAVVSHELASAVLAEQLNADRLVLLTDDPPGLLDRHNLDVRTLVDVRKAVAADPSLRLFRAACHFVDASRRKASIGSLHDARAVIDGDHGILVVPE